MALNRDITRAINSTSQLAVCNKIMALNSDAMDGCFFVNDDVSTCLDAPIPYTFDIVILE